MFQVKDFPLWFTMKWLCFLFFSIEVAAQGEVAQGEVDKYLHKWELTELRRRPYFLCKSIYSHFLIGLVIDSSIDLLI